MALKNCVNSLEAAGAAGALGEGGAAVVGGASGVKICVNSLEGDAASARGADAGSGGTFGATARAGSTAEATGAKGDCGDVAGLKMTVSSLLATDPPTLGVDGMAAKLCVGASEKAAVEDPADCGAEGSAGRPALSLITPPADLG